MIKHPLESLTEDEINKAVDLYKSHDNSDENTLFTNITLVEPSKEIVRNYKDGDGFDRSVKIVGVDSNPDGGFVASVDLNKEEVSSVERLPNEAQAAYSLAEVGLATMLTKENKDYKDALKKRDVTNLDLVQIDPWPGGGVVHESIKPGHRAMKTISFLKENKNDNAYAKPIQGVISHVDLTLNEVTCVEDFGVVPIPKAHARYDADSQDEMREQPKPIEITQPEGSGFDVEGNQISWEGWQLRVSTHPVEGPVLHQVSLNKRPLLYRASLSDMVVPYGSADPMHSWKAVHDGTEYGIGNLTNSLTLGCDCLGDIFLCLMVL